jgi:anion-transporting  ArsA/GET3 family ATPase
LLEYLADHGMKRISKRLVATGALDVVATAIPGIRDILVLGKVKSLERERAADLILVDAPATGHAMTFLSSAQGLVDAARSGPVRAQATDVIELLSDPDRCQVTLVTLPEEMPVNEAIEAAYELEDRIGVSLGPVIVNACLPADPRLSEDPVAAANAVGVSLDEEQAAALGDAAAFRAHRFSLQEEQRARLAAELPLPQLQARFLFATAVGPEELELLATDLADAVRRLPDSESSTSGLRTARRAAGDARLSPGSATSGPSS